MTLGIGISAGRARVPAPPPPAGEAEVTRITINQGDGAGFSYHEKHFTMEDAEGSVSVQFSTGGETPPEGFDRNIVVAFTADDPAELLASLLQAAMDADEAFSATINGVDVTITDAATGAREDATAGALSSGEITVTIDTQGS